MKVKKIIVVTLLLVTLNILVAQDFGNKTLPFSKLRNANKYMLETGIIDVNTLTGQSDEFFSQKQYKQSFAAILAVLDVSIEQGWLDLSDKESKKMFDNTKIFVYSRIYYIARQMVDYKKYQVEDITAPDIVSLIRDKYFIDYLFSGGIIPSIQSIQAKQMGMDVHTMNSISLTDLNSLCTSDVGTDGSIPKVHTLINGTESGIVSCFCYSSNLEKAIKMYEEVKSTLSKQHNNYKILVELFNNDQGYSPFSSSYILAISFDDKKADGSYPNLDSVYAMSYTHDWFGFNSTNVHRSNFTLRDRWIYKNKDI